METVLKQGDLKVGMTIKILTKKSIKEDPLGFIEGIIDFIGTNNFRIVGYFKSNRIFKILNYQDVFKNKVVKPEYDLLLPDDIIKKSKLDLNRKIEFSKPIRNKKICNAEFQIGDKIRYFYPNPVIPGQSIDCILSQKMKDYYVFRSIDFTDDKRVVIFVEKTSDAEYTFLTNKKIKLFSEDYLKEESESISLEKKQVIFSNEVAERHKKQDKKNKNKKPTINKGENKIKKAIKLRQDIKRKIDTKNKTKK